MSLRGVNHLTLATSDVARLTHFYVDVLGCRRIAQWPVGAYLLAGELWLAIVDGPDETRTPSDYSHVAFDATPAALAEIDRRADAESVERWQDNWTEGDSIYLIDPAGHRIEVHSNNLADRIQHAREHPWDGLVIDPDAASVLERFC